MTEMGRPTEPGEHPSREDQPGLPDTEPIVDLEKKSIRGATATLSSQGLIFLTTLVSTSVLAHTLSPSDFGLLAMVTPIVSFMMLFQDLGLSMASVQRRDLSGLQVNQLFWVNTWAGLLLTLVVLAASPLVAMFFHDPRLRTITMALAGTFFISGLAAQQRALLMRKMKLTFLSIVQVVGSIMGAVAGVLAAALGLGYWSLVILNLVRAVVVSIGVWALPQFRPGLPSRLRGVRDVVTFGMDYTAFRVLNFVARNVDNLLIGRFWGSTELGYYSRAYSLLLLPLNQLMVPFQNVAIPGLSRLQDDSGRYARYYLRAVSMLGSLALPAVVALIILAQDVVAVFLGPQWGPSVRIFRVLGITGALHVSYLTISWIYISLGTTRRLVHWWAIAVVVTAAGILAGLHWGGFGVAVGYTCANVLLYFPGLWHATRNTPLNVRRLLKAQVGALTIAVVVGAVAAISLVAASTLELYSRLLVEVLACVCAWVAASVVVNKRDSPVLRLLEMMGIPRRGGL